MKKISILFSLVFLFLACSDDDALPNEELFGTWKLVKKLSNGIEKELSKCDETFTFFPEKILLRYDLRLNEEGDCVPVYDRVSYDKYFVRGNTITLTKNGYGEIKDFTVTGDILKLYYSSQEYYYKRISQ